MTRSAKEKLLPIGEIWLFAAYRATLADLKQSSHCLQNECDSFFAERMRSSSIDARFSLGVSVLVMKHNAATAWPERSLTGAAMQ